jgi:RNA polymerase sigma-70 factor (ECF subfamily)
MSERTNEQWLADLSASGPIQEAALADLRAKILAGLPYALNKWLSPDSPQYAALVEEVAQETLLRVLRYLDTFEGRSRFTTWVYKIAVRLALTELRRKRWTDLSLEEMVDNPEGFSKPQLMEDPAPTPEASTEKQDLLARVMRIVDEELTGKQREAMLALSMQGLPMDEVAASMGSNPNALYKLMHDARLRLKRRLAKEGLTPADILAVFERG